MKAEQAEDFGIRGVALTQRIWRYLSGLVFGFAMAWVISTLVGRFWPDARLVVFVVLVAIWLSGFVQIVARDIRAGGEEDRTVFADPERCDTAELPQEFHFVDHVTTVRD